jgi:hypothetical protein
LCWSEPAGRPTLDGATLAYRYLPNRSNDTVLDEIRLQAAMIAKATEMLALGVSKQAAQQRFSD